MSFGRGIRNPLWSAVDADGGDLSPPLLLLIVGLDRAHFSDMVAARYSLRAFLPEFVLPGLDVVVPLVCGDVISTGQPFATAVVSPPLSLLSSDTRELRVRRSYDPHDGLVDAALSLDCRDP